MTNPQTIYVRPVPADSKVFDPATRDFLPPEGRDVTPGIYWDRRINDGSVATDRQKSNKNPK